MVDFGNKTKGKEVTTQQHPLPVPGNEAPQLPAIPDPKELEEVFKEGFEGGCPTHL